jgi:dipeptidyl aminopeptidase/acylaminoacyl peptidase
MTSQIAGWKTAQSEVISWKSKDGAVIEGVLHKLANYDPSKKYPLLVMIHGGPTGIDVPQPVPGSVSKGEACCCYA